MQSSYSLKRRILLFAKPLFFFILLSICFITFADEIQGTQIAVLLPLSGPAATAGNAVLEGILAQYYTNENQSAVLKFYDTNQNSIVNLYKQALSKGANLIIGPLQHENVDKLKYLTRGEIPILALNYASHSYGPAPNFYEFGLAPENDAIQIANGAYQQGHRNALVIMPNNAWGKGIATSFMSTWQKLGGKVVDGLMYSPHADFQSAIHELLYVNQSEDRAKRLEKILGQKFQFIPQSREDIDMIFLVATPNYARQIVPLVRYNYAASLAIYSISLINEGLPTSNYNHDVNGVTFVDLPFLLNTENHKKFHELYANNNPFQNRLRFYALGSDAYLLSQMLPQFSNDPNFKIQGLTGSLYINQNQQILQTLDWAKFNNGSFTAVNS